MKALVTLEDTFNTETEYCDKFQCDATAKSVIVSHVFNAETQSYECSAFSESEMRSVYVVVDMNDAFVFNFCAISCAEMFDAELTLAQVTLVENLTHVARTLEALKIDYTYARVYRAR
jgi:hypothetical protein